jgi:hypothetical protein
MSQRSSSRTSVTVLFLVVAVVLIYLAVSPLALSSATYVAAAVLLAGMGIVTVITASKAPSTGSLGQLLYAPETPPAAGRSRQARQVRGW